MSDRDTNSDSYLFVYGTLRPNASQRGRKYAEALSREAEHVGRGRAGGRLYLVDWYPALRNAPNRREEVVGDVYRVPRGSGLLAMLDLYEDASTTPDPEREYTRRKRTVRLEDGRKLKAWTYLYNRPLDERRAIPGGDFLARRARSSPKAGKSAGG